MTRSFLAAAFLAAIALPALAATDEELRKVLIGSWSDSTACSAGVVSFAEDGTFLSRNLTNGNDDRKGTFTVKDGKLNGKAPDQDMPDVKVIFENGELYFENDSGHRDRLYPCENPPQ